MTRAASKRGRAKRAPVVPTLWVAWMFAHGHWQIDWTGEDLKHVKAMVGGFGIRHRFVQYRAVPPAKTRNKR